MTQTLVLCSQKGGTGKTSVGLNLISAFAASGRRVLMVDLDPQASATAQLGVVYGLGEHSIAECIINAIEGDDPDTTGAIRATASGIDVLGPSGEMERASDELVMCTDYLPVLRTVLDEVRDSYDVIVIDTPPNLGRLPLLAFAASPQVHAIGVSNGEPQSVASCLNIKERMNQVAPLVDPPGPQWVGTVVNKFESRRTESHQAVAALEEQGSMPFSVIIPNHVHVIRASTTDRPAIMSYADSKVAERFVQLTIEIMTRVADMSAHQQQEAS